MSKKTAYSGKELGTALLKQYQPMLKEALSVGVVTLIDWLSESAAKSDKKADKVIIPFYPLIKTGALAAIALIPEKK